MTNGEPHNVEPLSDGQEASPIESSTYATVCEPSVRADAKSDVRNIVTDIGSCKFCGAPFVPGEEVCVKCQRFAPGNQRHRGLGLRAQHQPPEVRMSAEELMAGITSDRGGADELSTLERSYIRKLGDVEICIRLLTSNIAQYGLFTPGGKVRDVYDKLLAGLATFDRYGQRIGPGRNAKVIDIGRMSASEYGEWERQQQQASTDNEDQATSEPEEARNARVSA